MADHDAPNRAEKCATPARPHTASTHGENKSNAECRQPRLTNAYRDRYSCAQIGPRAGVDAAKERSVHFRRTGRGGMPIMISDLDIWRAANLVMKRYGADAELVAAQRADLMLDRGDRDGPLVWIRIMRAIVELQAPAMGKPN
jgi:hypothetical protein